MELDDYDCVDPALWITLDVDTPIGVPLDIDACIRFKSDLGAKLEENGIYAFPVATLEPYEEAGDGA